MTEQLTRTVNANASSTQIREQHPRMRDRADPA
jgi:hypothetical protein